MVCKTGCGRMVAMARLLTVGSCPGITPEEDAYEKIAAQIIHKEFHDADEVNLLEEEGDSKRVKIKQSSKKSAVIESDLTATPKAYHHSI